MGKYVLERQLATGGMGTVYLARQVGPNGFERPCVVKTMHAHHASNPEFVSLFLNEARLSAQLNHPNIAQVYDFGQSPDSYYLAMEHVEGLSLQALLERAEAQEARLDIGLVSKIVSQVAMALDYAHRRSGPQGPLDLVHRDISPGNVMLSTEGVVKVIDFGIAKASTTDNFTEKGAVRGKLAYLSPEHLWGDAGRLDGRADLFSLGLVWYELLTGRRAIAGKTDREIIEAARVWRVTPVRALRPECPSGLVALLERALARNKAERFQTGRELSHAIETQLVHEGLIATQAMLAGLVTDVPGEDSWAERSTLTATPEAPPITPVHSSRWTEEKTDGYLISEVLAAQRGSAPVDDSDGEIDISEAELGAESPTLYAHAPAAVEQAVRDEVKTARARSGLSTDKQARVPPPAGSEAKAHWLGEALRANGVALPEATLKAIEQRRSAVAELASIAWVLVAEPVNQAAGSRALTALVGLASDLASWWEGVLDAVDGKHLQILFFGEGAQARAVLAGLELRDRLLDGDVVRCRLAVNGGYISVSASKPVTGEPISAIGAVIAKATTGQLLMPAKFGNSIKDLVETRPVHDEQIEIIGRRPLQRPLQMVGRAGLIAALTKRLLSGEARPFVITGVSGSGRTALAHELERIARLEGFTVCLTQNPPSLRGVASGAVIDLVCQLCDVPPSQRFLVLPRALDFLGLTPAQCEAVLAVTNNRGSEPQCELSYTVAALRLVLDAYAQADRNWVVVFDGLESLDPTSQAVFQALCHSPRPNELIIGLTTTEQAKSLGGIESHPIPDLSRSDIGQWLTTLLGQPPSTELLSALERRARCLPSLMVAWSMLAFDLGLLRPRGTGLVLEGPFPPLGESGLAAARVRAAGARISRLLAMTLSLGDDATVDALERALPGHGVARLLAGGLVRNVNGVLRVTSLAIERAVLDEQDEMTA